jgi:uncharacterized repeat protein (TIGR04076 family)
MDKEEKVDDLIWQAVQQRVGYTDAEMELFKKRPFPHKILQTKVITDVIRTNIIFEIVEAHNCNVGHKAGDKFYFNGEGYIITSKCPEKICPHLMPFMARMMWLIPERLYEGLDPKPTFPFGHCDDVGVRCGGMGQVLMEVKYTYDPI